MIILRIILLPFVLFSFTETSFCQELKLNPPSVDHPLSEIVQSLVGDGIEISKFRTNQRSGSAIGSFEAPWEGFGMEKGLMMTTGSIFNAVGPNSSEKKGSNNRRSGDPVLEKLLGNNVKTYDACILELEVIPKADTMAFNFMFASEEYDKFVGSEYNDVFAFFIKGKGIENGRNIALIPNTDQPVSINNVNHGNMDNEYPAVNPIFYIKNTDSLSMLEYNGYTKLIEVKQAVVPNETYILRLSIADVSDGLLDSGVFIEGNSLHAYHESYQVRFPSGKYNLDGTSISQLNNLLRKMQMTKSDKVELAGHTDSEGNYDANMELSNNRVNAVVNYLVNQGVKKDHIKIYARGETMPIANNDTEYGKKQNRRVEIKLLGSD
ncbi:OmpA family protein [Flexithrix dorotheae]|uniref:OmpA family protein n=1 Tax=Flexithrix dorotheae TaxID=70993 RepID=UPI000371C8C3|nr:OmpA family protein [Flexithrix dorotheae]